MKTGKTIVKDFIKNNELDFSGTGSDLNGHCTTLAGFICHVFEEYEEGLRCIKELRLSEEAFDELVRVHEYAYNNNYYMFWDTPGAKELYKF